MDRSNIKNSTGIMIHLPTNSLLLLRDLKKKDWTTPGGKIDPNDSRGASREFTAFKREFYEETGYPLPLLKIHSSFDYGRHAHTKVYVCTFTDYINFRQNNEIDQMAFVNLDSLIYSDFSLIDYPLKLYVRNSLIYAGLETGELKISFNLDDETMDVCLTRSTFKPALLNILYDKILPNLTGDIWRIQPNYKNSKTLKFIMAELSNNGIPIYQILDIPIDRVMYQTANLIIHSSNGIEIIAPLFSV